MNSHKLRPSITSSLMTTKMSLYRNINSNSNSSHSIQKRQYTTQHGEKIITIPNILSTTRLLLSPIIATTILTQQYTLSLSLFTIASFTDFFDGYIARKYNQKSKLGTFLDPIADKSLMTLTTLSMTPLLLPYWLTTLIIGRDICLSSVVTYKYLKKDRNVEMELRPTMISKFNTVFQMLLLSGTLLSTSVYGLDGLNSAVMEWSRGIVGVSTGLSILSYMLQKDTIIYTKLK